MCPTRETHMERGTHRETHTRVPETYVPTPLTLLISFLTNASADGNGDDDSSTSTDTTDTSVNITRLDAAVGT